LLGTPVLEAGGVQPGDRGGRGGPYTPSRSGPAEGCGILRSIADLPRTKSLGIELRASAALAAPVSMLDGSFEEEPFRIRFDLGGDPAARTRTVSSTLRQLVDHFSWKGVVGCSVTREVSRQLGVEGDDLSALEAGMGPVISRMLRGKASFCHTVVHTDAAGYNELVWGSSADKSRWGKQVVLVCTLGKNLGAVLFSNGRRVRNSPLPLRSIDAQTEQSSEEKFEPPPAGSPEFDKWADVVDEGICELIATVSTLDRVIVLGTGRTARAVELSATLLPRLTRTRDLAEVRGCEVTMPEQREGFVVRGVALCALVELQATQIARSLETVVNSGEPLHSLSKAQLRLLYDKIDLNCRGGVELCDLQEGMEVLGVHTDSDTMAREIGTSRDGIVSFSRFMDWWSREFCAARVVRITSAGAWRQLLDLEPPPGFGDLLLLEVTFTFCRSCRRFEPKFRRFAEQFSKVRFVQLVGNGTVGAMELSTKELGVTVSPAFFVFRRGGELLAHWDGSDAERFQSQLAKCLAAEEQAADASRGL